MTKYLTKPIRAIHFMVLAFLMTLSSPVAAQDYEKGSAAYNAGDYATALQEWTPLAEAGDADAQFRLGFSHHHGKGVPKDYADAVKWYRLAAVQGSAVAQAGLAAMYSNGFGVPQDMVMAHMWYNTSAANGDLFSVVLRDMISNLMTPAAIENAQAMATECMNSDYTKCGY